MNENTQSEAERIFLLKELFSEEIYTVAAKPAAAENNSESQFFGDVQTLPLHGNTNGNILLLMNYGGKNQIPPEDKTFLGSVIKAVQINAGQIAWLNQADVPQLNWQKLAENSRADVILSFGATENILPEGIAKGEIYTIDNKRVMNAWPLEEIAKDNNKKKVLWQGLKEIFNL